MSIFIRFFFLFFILGHFLIARSSHLLLVEQGEGGLISINGEQTKLLPASFLPLNQAISIRPRSGIETMMAGYQFRFGAETNFTIHKEFLELQSGSIFFQSRKMDNTITLSSPESSFTISGISTCMVEVETNGGMKILCLLGRAILRSHSTEGTFPLLPGELTFIKPGSSTIADIINVNLERVVASSYLVSGFKNSPSFNSSIQSVVKAQKESIGKTFRAEVGDAKTPDSFEIIAISEDEVIEEIPTPKVEFSQESEKKNSTSSAIKNVDPLSELLGRPPVRVQSRRDPFSSPENSGSSSPRPFPGSLLRKNN